MRCVLKVFCQKLQREGEKLPRKPVPGALGERVYENICVEAWQLWLGQQTMLINEYKLCSFEPEAQEFLNQKMVEFLFSGQSVAPEQYRPQE